MMPRWLTEHLAATGVLNADGISRTAHVRRCQGCPTWTVVGLDADRAAGPVTADVTPLSRVGEALALLAGRPTYTLRRTAGRLELDHRHRWAIAGNPIDGGDYDVVTEHHCGTSPLPATNSRLRPQQIAAGAHGPPPY